MRCENAALIVVDMQCGFVNEHSRPIVPAVVELVRTWPADVVFTKFVNTRGSAYERLVGWHRMQKPPDTDMISSLLPYTSTVVEKNGYTFFNDRGREIATMRGWKEVVLCGIATDGGVLKSAIDAFEFGYVPFIVEDACASDAGVEAHEAALDVASRCLGHGQLIQREDVMDTPSLTRSLVGAPVGAAI